MNINQRYLVTYKGVVEATFDQVFNTVFQNCKTGPAQMKDLLLPLDVLGEPNRPVVIEGGPQKYTIFEDKDRSERIAYMDIDKSNCMLTYYGGWWFRLEYHLFSHPNGCQITMNIINVAPGASRILLLFSKEFRSMFKEEYKSRIKKSFEDALGRVGKLNNGIWWILH